MKLTSLHLTTFRNHAATKHAFEQSLTIFVGSNAAGKTSLLEAIRCLSLAKSFRASSDRDLIHHEATFCRVEAAFERNQESRLLTYFTEQSPVSTSATRKRVTIDGVKRPMKQLLGTLPTVLFTPEDLALISDSPSTRRTYLDTLLCQLSPEYYAALVSLKHVLKQRNSLLAQIRDGEASIEQLDVWDAPFAMHAKVILDARRSLIETFNAQLTDTYRKISNQTEATLQLDPSFTLDCDDITCDLVTHQDADIRAGRSLRGPHRDDIRFILNDYPLSSFGSRGEQRSAILALKMAELDILEEQFGERPILLLDDIFSELDQDRQNALLSLVRRQQTFVTTTDLAHLHPETTLGATSIHVHKGSVSINSPVCEPPTAAHAHPDQTEQPEDSAAKTVQHTSEESAPVTA